MGECEEVDIEGELLVHFRTAGTGLKPLLLPLHLNSYDVFAQKDHVYIYRMKITIHSCVQCPDSTGSGTQGTIPIFLISVLLIGFPLSIFCHFDVICRYYSCQVERFPTQKFHYQHFMYNFNVFFIYSYKDKLQ